MKLPRASLLVLGLLAMSAIAACGDPRTPEGSGYRTEIEFEPTDGGGTLPAVRAEDVKILSSKDPPKGVAFRGPQHPRLAKGYPSPERPHQRVGSFEVRESIDWQLEVFDDAAFVARREDAVRKAAAEKGANAVYVDVTTEVENGSRAVHYEAYRLSDAEPVYPSTDEVLTALRLQAEGFKEVQRFTSELSELGTRKPENATLKLGHAYVLAMALHRGPVDMQLGDRQSLGFVLKVERPISSGDRRGAFNRRLDKDYGDPLVSFAVVDGIFARGGMGFMGESGLRLQVEVVTRTAAIEIARVDGIKGPIPVGELGQGTADFVVYERKASADELHQAVCGYCRTTAQACSKREPLDACDELKRCFQTIEKPLSGCSADYKDI